MIEKMLLNALLNIEIWKSYGFFKIIMKTKSVISKLFILLVISIYILMLSTI